MNPFVTSNRSVLRLSFIILSWILFSSSVSAQNLLPNVGFEEGDAGPRGWKMPDTQAKWVSPGFEGQRAIQVQGNGSDSTAWQIPARSFQPGGLYRLRFFARRDAQSGGGCVISGPSWANHDFTCGPEWQQFSYAFSFPQTVATDTIRLGHWQARGQIYFDQAELWPVIATHHVQDGIELGEGESIRHGVYRFQPNFGWAGANYHRPLWRNKCRFNSDRWCFEPGSEVVYRLQAGDHLQSTGRIRVQINYHTGGQLRMEGSLDRTHWIHLATFDGNDRGKQFELPGVLAPRRELYVRLAYEGLDGGFQVNTFEYEAVLLGKTSDIEGETWLSDVLQSSPEIKAGLVQLDTKLGQGQVGVRLNITNLSSQTMPVSVGITNSKSTSVGPPQKAILQPGQTASFSPALSGVQPGLVDFRTVVSDEDGQTLFASRTEARVSFLYDPRPGYRLQGIGGLNLWWCESGWKIGREAASPGDHRPAQPVTLAAAGGESESAQIILRSGQPGQSLLSAVPTPFQNAQGERAPMAVRLNEVAYVHVTRPTDASSEQGWYPDPLPPLITPLEIPDKRNLALWLTVSVPPKTKAGNYTGHLLLNTSLGEVRVPLQVHVYGFDLPPEPHLRSAFGLDVSPLHRYHKVTSEADRKAVYEKYLKNFAEHRISPYSFFAYSPIDIRFEGQGTNKVARVDFTRFDEAATLWLDQYKFSSFLLPLRGMGGGTFHSRHLGQLEGFQEGTPEHSRLFQDYLGQVEKHLKDKDWLRKAYTYWFDEPDPKDYEFVREGMKRIKAAAPGLRRMLTEQPEPELMGHVEIWCGLTPEWTPQKVRARTEAGEEVWWYVCTGPKAPYVTLFIDHPGTEMRLWPWQSWQYGVQGILVWAANYWTSPSAFPNSLQDPYADPMGYVSGYDYGPGHIGYWGNGDGRFLYPPRRDPNAATQPSLEDPVNSVRWENLRDGMEDYEYFWLLRDRVNDLTQSHGENELIHQAKALLEVPADISTDLTHWTTDPRRLLEHRGQMAALIERMSKPAESAAGPALRKLLDTPLRDTAICRGPDDAWYMTGTVEPFWAYNEGICLWKSKDLVHWNPLGMVWRYGASPWHEKYLKAKKPLWAPEIHYLKGTFWLTYSMPGWDGTAKTSGCGLLKSLTGKPEGPYQDMQPEERMGDEIDASLFEDDDGSVYFLWHSGKIARLKPDFSGLAEPYRWLKTSVPDPDPKHHSGLCAGIFGSNSFDHVGYEGMFLFKAHGRYYLSCAENFEGRYSCAIATSTNLFGPYSARYEALPHAGHNTFFKDDHGHWWSTYFGSDDKAPWRERPGLLPIEFDSTGRVHPKHLTKN